MDPAPMPKDICCENYKGLLAYIRNHYGQEGVRKLTAGLLDGNYWVRDKLEPNRIIPIGRHHLNDPAYWVSNDFSLRLLANVKAIVPGPNPLYTAGYGMVRENLAQTTLFIAKLIGTQRMARRAARINARFNRTKDVHLAAATDTSLTFELDYRSGYKLTRDVCNWNLGIYTGIGALTGVVDIQGHEAACVLDGAPKCRFHITWKKSNRLPGGLRGLLASVRRSDVQDLIVDYEQSIEEREALIDRLAASENKYRALFEDSLQPMSLCQNGRLVDVNPAWLALHGYKDKPAVLGKDVIDFIHPQDHELLKTRRRNWSTDTERIVRMRDIAFDGTKVEVEVFSCRIEYGGEISILATVRDITDLKKAENSHRQLEARLQRAEKMEAVATLAGGVAHDLNNILSGIVSYPELLLMQLPPDSSLVGPLETIQDSGKKAAAIVEDLLTLARRGVTTRDLINLNRLVRQYLESPEYYRMLSDYPGVEVNTRLSSDLLNLSGSPVHLSKTLMNLVSNAVEAMPDGGRITITTANRHIEPQQNGFEEMPTGDYCHLEVSDNGIGIAPEDREKVFEPFYTKKKMGRSGTGLGMAVVWGTVQDHDGFIRLQSEIGQGTTIQIFLPASHDTESADPVKKSRITHFRGRGELVLVVDDIAEQRDIARQILEAMGYRVAVAASGEEALAWLENATCDLVLLDMIMEPGIDGLDTYRHIVHRVPGQKAVIVTGYSETDRVKTAQALGAGKCLRKPYTFENLGQTIREELDRPVPPASALASRPRS
jgi:PAS domain S-box-containing protein